MSEKQSEKQQNQNHTDEGRLLDLPGINHVLSKTEAVPCDLLQYRIPVVGNQEWPLVC